jgi:hypothetical protein
MDLIETYGEDLLENAKKYLENPDLGTMASALTSNPDNKDNIQTAISLQFKQSLNNLNNNLKNLNKNLYESSKTSSKLQRWLIGWTIIMALAVLSQAVLIGIQLFG